MNNLSKKNLRIVANKFGGYDKLINCFCDPKTGGNLLLILFDLSHPENIKNSEFKKKFNNWFDKLCSDIDNLKKIIELLKECNKLNNIYNI